LLSPAFLRCSPPPLLAAARLPPARSVADPRARPQPKSGSKRPYRTSLLRTLSEELRHLRF
jgi:hypothetical protein